MTIKKTLLTGVAMTVLFACGDTSETPVAPPAAPDSTSASTLLVDDEVDAGIYNLEKTHASLIWTVSHNGLSKYTARFTEFDTIIDLVPDDPAASTVTAVINPSSVRTDHPSGEDWDTTLGQDEKWFNGVAFPEITFSSTGIDLTGDRTAIVTGELSLLGITQSVPLEVTYNGMRNFARYGDLDVIGFSATANLKRSDFGMTALLPAIGDEVEVTIEIELIQAE